MATTTSPSTHAPIDVRIGSRAGSPPFDLEDLADVAERLLTAAEPSTETLELAA